MGGLEDVWKVINGIALGPLPRATCFKSGNPPNAVASNLGGSENSKSPQNGGFRGRMQSNGDFSDIL